MLKNSPKLLLTCIPVVLVACDRGPDSPVGFSLPPGDPDQGKLLFEKFECNACHTIIDATQTQDSHHQTAKSGNSESSALPDGIKVKIGREVAHVVTYAEVVTSIINPSHRIATKYGREVISPDGSSTMKSYNDIMTITELTDLVSYIQPFYRVAPYQPTYYGIYP